ncbi:glycoside hydrolase family 28 protein [Micromonospora yasonensis]|uniref:glycoside hydrolase family 28 protein n=1 Tax=Micromonospora yasonensis TaxID=1128667 RepID=UPI00222F64B1|nr:glycoside hydrolase family 28 protein [Micromonospora yasonensis]MCW3840760.1 glycoside hydrolase family 28 protein [Micromonospora yasonensis]
MTTEHTRRHFLRLAGAAGVAVAFTPVFAGPAAADPLPAGYPWARAEYINAKVRRPHFPNRWYDIQDFGAVGDGATSCTEAFKRAIQECHSAGGGHVVVPAGRWLTGPIHLLSNVDLHVTAAAVVLFSQTPADYLPAVLTRFEGVELYNYSPLIYAYGQENIGVTGAGVLDGQADNAHWWPWKGKAEYGWKKGDPKQDAARNRLFAMAEQGVPVEQRVFGEGDCLRSSFIEPYRCRNVIIEGVTILRSPMWEIHPTLSENVLVQNVTVNSHGPNNDGCDPESSRMVVIRDCTFDTGDDCIAIKAGRNADGRRVATPSEDILIEGCLMRDGHGGVTIGSEMSGGVRNVFVRDCEMSSPNLDIALRFKTNSVRGGFITGFYARDITIGEVAGAVIDVNFFYEEGPGYGFNPVVGAIDVRNLTVRSAARGLNLRGYADDHINGVTLTDVDFGTTSKPDVVEYVDNLVLRNVIENGAPLVLNSVSA